MTVRSFQHAPRRRGVGSSPICYVRGLFGPEQVWTVHHAITHNITATVSCSHSSSFCCNRTSTHNPRTRDFWAPDGLQSDIDTDRVMVSTDTGILIRNSNLNDFQIKMNSVFNTISEWFMVNSLSLNLNKTFYGIKLFRIQKYIIRIMMRCKRRKLKILPLPSQFILSLLVFVINSRNQFTINSEIHSKNSRQFNNFHQPRYNLSKYQEVLQH
jgi:hypothetical protein